MNAFATATELLRQASSLGGLPTKEKSVQERCEKAAERLRKLTESINERNPTVATEIPTSLSDFCRDISSNFAIAANDPSLDIWKLGEMLGELMTNIEQLQQSIIDHSTRTGSVK